MEKEIKGYPGYTITDDGKVISHKYRQPRVMKTWLQESGYENIKLCKQNVTSHHLVHRLVAEAFIPNPDNLPEVNHKNKIRNDNRVENLEWYTRKENLFESYTTMSPVRNFKRCRLIRESDGKVIDSFQSISAASRYANEHFGCSISGMKRNHVSKGYKVEVE